MRIVSDNIKNALKQPTTQRKGRILVNGNYYEVYNVEYYADAYEDGNVIGNAIASQLDFDLPYMDKFDTFKYFDGVWTGNEYEYVDMGTFTVFDERDEDEFNKHITAFDNLIKFNKPFEETGTYPKTLYEELQNICQQAGVELVNTTIPNGNFQIENNQFVNGETLKTILKAICQISGNYGIIKEDKLVLQLTNDTDETILKNQHEPVVWKRKTYGINQVILQLGDVEGEYVIRQDEEDIAGNGVHKLVITNNPFAYTQDKRDALVDELFNQVRGFGYIPYEMNYEWLNYLEIGDKITIDGIETLVLRIQGKSPKGLESFMSAPAIIDSAVEYADNTNNIKNQISRTEIIVDKQNQEIELIATKTEETTKTLKTDKSVESNGEGIYIEDSGGYDLEKLIIDGKSTQNGTPTPDAPVEIESVGYTNLFNKDNANILNAYLGSTKISASSSSRTIFIPCFPNTTYIIQKVIGNAFSVAYTENTPDIGVSIIGRINSKSSPTLTIITGANAKYLVSQIMDSGDTLTEEEILNSIQIEKGSISHSYIPFGKYGIEVKTVGKNLFDEEYARVISNYTLNEDIGANWKALTINLLPNTEYRYTLFADNVPTDGGYNLQMYLYEDTTNVLTYINNHSMEPTINKKSKTFTTGESGKIYLAGLYIGTDRLKTLFDTIDIQIEKGNIETEYEEYKSNTTVLQLNEPLRGLPNGVKDIAYIKNNKLYVDRYIENDSELATPVTEEIGFVSIPTFKNINHINLYGKISTSFGITYLTDSYLNEQFATKSEIKITNDEINILSKKIQPVSNTIKRTGEIKLENASEGLLHKLSIKGSISLIYPNNNLFPSSNLSPKIFKLQVDEILYDLDINYLNYINENVCDEFIYEDGNCYIIRRVGINENGEMYELSNEIFEKRKDVFINVLKNSTIKLLGFNNVIFEAKYLLQNQYTDVFATEAYVNSEIKQTADEINIQVAKKVNEDEVVSTINLSPEKIKLESNRLEIDSTYFKLSEEGEIESTSGKIGGYNLEKYRFFTNIERDLGFNLKTQEDFNKIFNKITAYINGTGTLTEEELRLYDLNFDGIVDKNDLLMIQSIYFGYLKIKGIFEINSNDATKTLNFIAEDGTEAGYIGLNGLKFYNITGTNASITNDLTTRNLTVKGNFNNLSDKRLKHDIKELDNNYANIIKELNPISFTYKQNNTKHIGFIAQDMEKIFSQNNIESIPVKIDETGIYSINYLDLIGILWKDNQILHREIDKLKEMIK